MRSFRQASRSLSPTASFPGSASNPSLTIWQTKRCRSISAADFTPRSARITGVPSANSSPGTPSFTRR
jgi:hypothetical protein